MSQTFSNVAGFLKLRGRTIVTVIALLVIAAVCTICRCRYFREGSYIPVLVAVPGGVTTTVLRIRTFALYFTTADRNLSGIARRLDGCQGWEIHLICSVCFSPPGSEENCCGAQVRPSAFCLL